MSQRGSHSHEDSRPDRRQDPDMGVQGRFGRQEDWRKVERQQASRKLTLPSRWNSRPPSSDA